MGCCGSSARGFSIYVPDPTIIVPTKERIALPDEDDFTVDTNTQRRYTVNEVYESTNLEFGRGAFGAVYKAHHIHKHNSLSRKLWHDVAVKKTAPTVLDTQKGPLYDARAVLENCQEIKALTLLRDSDPHTTRVLHLYEFFWEPKKGELTIVTEVLGEELDTWRQRQQTFFESSAQDIMSTLMDAVQFMHDRGVVHRDLKFQNILFRRENDFNSLKIVDFGLAKVLQGQQQTDEFCGSLGYIAPEMYKREAYRFGVDMFAMGVILFRLLSGVRPFASSNEAKLQHDTVNLRFTIQGTSWEGVSPEAIKLVRKLLIGQDERLNALQAVEHGWFSAREKSVLEADYAQQPGYEKNSDFSRLLSKAPPALAKDGNRFILESQLEPAVQLLIASGLYPAEVVDCHIEENAEHVFCVEEHSSSRSLVLPHYVAVQGVYTEKHGRRICKSVAEIIKVFHDNNMAHRNIHINNFAVDQKTKSVTVRGLRYAQAVEEGRPLTGHFGYLYSWYAFKAPEVDSELYHDKSVDMWSLGAVIYMLLTGLNPFRGEGADLVGNKHNGVIEFDICRISDSAQQLIRSLLKVNSADRLTIDEVLDSEWMNEADDFLDGYDLSLGLSFMSHFLE